LPGEKIFYFAGVTLNQCFLRRIRRICRPPKNAWHGLDSKC